MTGDRTQTQRDEEYRQAQRLSVERTRPPVDVEGYQALRCLGVGAYGEVWVALDRNTGRQVAIKFYAHRGGLDWSLLSREVEKLVFLSADRYVVQLLEVGWEADPPYYVMEYIEQGSLEDRLQARGALPVVEAVALFREVATGLVHAHGKGVLHCDLKPANVLLDQDGKPRLCDFGQSRLSHEQDPALGTLFYMAPEQADLEAVPDARWDVYALGALLYAMLTGAPPHRTDAGVAEVEAASDLAERLASYRKLIQQPLHLTRRRLAGVDRALQEILDRCLEVDPNRRFPNVQAVLAALDARDARRARRPLLVLGALGPLLLMLVMGLAGLRALNTAVGRSNEALTDGALAQNRIVAEFAARAVATEVELRFRAVEQVAADPEFQALLAATLSNSQLEAMRDRLNDPQLEDGEASEALREEFRNHPARQALQQRLEQLKETAAPQGDDAATKYVALPKVASWFVNDSQGLQLARADWNKTIGKNYAWRTYFHGRKQDIDESDRWRPQAGEHINETTLSTVFRSQATGRWIVGVSTPVYRGGPDGEFLGIVALTVEVGEFVELPKSANHLAVLVDWRDGRNKGVVLQHPLFRKLAQLPEWFQDYRVTPEALPAGDRAKRTGYRDPMAADESGASLQGPWLAEIAPVAIRDRESGLMVIVQQRHEEVIGPALATLRGSLLKIGIVALVAVAVLLPLLWGFVARGLAGPASAEAQSPESPDASASAPSAVRT